jgi:hypothetical protein
MLLHFRRFVFASVNMHKNNPKIHFIYLGNKEIYCILKTSCLVSVLFSAKCRLFHSFTFFCSNNTHTFHTPCAKI